MAEPTDLSYNLFSADEEWLSRQSEPVIDPDLPIIDPHHHFWDRPSRYLFDELLKDTGSGHNIRATCYMQCRSMYRADGPPEFAALGETEFVNGIAAMSASGLFGPIRICAGIVGHADLLLGARAGAVLEAQIRAGNGRFRGIRNSSDWHADDSIRGTPVAPPKGLLLDAKFREGFACLAPLGLTFDGWMWWTQLGEFASLADAFPETGMVLDHFGGVLGIGAHTGKLAEDFPAWQKAIRDVAKRANVSIKLGGLSMRTAGFGLRERPAPAGSEELAGLWKPYFETCVEAFGVERCMFESNFPVDKVCVSYGTLWNAFKRLAAGCSAAEKSALFFGTAAKVYKLDIKPSSGS